MRMSAAARAARRVSALAAALVIILLAGSCAGPSQADPGGSPGSGDMTLNVGRAGDPLAFFPVFVAGHEGYFADEHLALGAQPRLGTGPKLDAALAGGSIDLAAGGTTDMFSLPRAGSTPRAVAALAGSQDVVHGIAFTTPAVLASKPRPTEAFVIGVARAEHLIRTASPATVGRLLSAYLPALKPATVSRLVPVLRQEIPATPAISPAAYRAAVNFHEAAGLSGSPPAYSATVASSLISSAMDAVPQAGS